ncbi:MAG TPA: carboxypeptidase-like regulatory domain-containing protein [Candidatus Dormibacteraeota bacterium]|nr:carboxypeptidase-like regulatory domain-containing protein [Candidatus Dormibacteraeota bacterium]
MKLAPVSLQFHAVLVILCLFVCVPAQAQSPSAVLAGTVTSQSGTGIAKAAVTIKNMTTGQSTTATTNSTGFFSATNLAAGTYEVSASADGFTVDTEHITLAAGETQHVKFSLIPPLSLSNLGFAPSQTQGNAQEQARLNKRSHMLQMHQRLGLITLVPLVATVVSGGFAGGHSTSSADRDFHAALGSTTAGLYFATAYYAIFAPKIPGTKTEGAIKWHKALAWVHGPGMILTPILGAMAFDQKSKGEKVHGIAQAHGAVAIVTAAAYGAAILSVSINPQTKHHLASIFEFHHSHRSHAALGDEAFLGE